MRAAAELEEEGLKVVKQSALKHQVSHTLYSKEKLTAKRGALFLCTIAGIGDDQTERNTTPYIRNWIVRLQQDDRLILTAAAAQCAVDPILGTSFGSHEEAAEVPANRQIRQPPKKQLPLPAREGAIVRPLVAATGASLALGIVCLLLPCHARLDEGGPPAILAKRMS